jgi:hypothetical protein
MRLENWKDRVHGAARRGTLQVWAEPLPFSAFRSCSISGPIPFERADTTSNTYYDWELTNSPVMAGSVILVGKYLESYKDFPPSQRPASFTIDQAIEKLKQGFGASVTVKTGDAGRRLSRSLFARGRRRSVVVLRCRSQEPSGRPPRRRSGPRRERESAPG